MGDGWLMEDWWLWEMGGKLGDGWLIGRWVAWRDGLLSKLVARLLAMAALHINKQWFSANNFPFMNFQKRFSQTSLLISTKYFQNRIILFSLKFANLIVFIINNKISKNSYVEST
jgi:hypothetical protein